MVLLLAIMRVQSRETKLFLSDSVGYYPHNRQKQKNNMISD